ncbi:FkbM family methyltransferase [Streptomyces sp. NPDC052396]|uniref:FkbM family methyltransferase n=1 Tax=Streptomyces sp. NPDC052396 TaxID=3365689 RepID=UPI0037D02E75
MSNLVVEALISAGRRYIRYAPGSLAKAPLAARILNPLLRDFPRQEIVRSADGVKYLVDTRDLIQRYIYMFGVWEPHLTCWLRRRLQPGDTFVDVGANVGYFSLLAARLVGADGQIAAVEASPLFHRRMLEQLELNGFRNVRAVNAAVADVQKELTFTLASSHNLGANSIVPYDGAIESSFSIDASPLPDVLTLAEIVTARLIKIDVEGAEGAVVRGMSSMIGELRDDAEIAVEVDPQRMAKLGDSVDELLSTFSEYGFHPYRLVNDYSPASYPVALRCPLPWPERLRGPITAETEVLFSRIDADRLS